MSASSTRSPILWGAYLACSWTWCIGMFLPALLLRDMGWSGFLVFAIPNVLGAAAMGWILKSRIDSIHFVESHPTAIWWFSAITLAFHFFWILWLSHFIWTAFSIPTPYLAGVAGLVSLFAILSGKASRKEKLPLVAVALLLFSLGVLLATFCTPDLQNANAAQIGSAPKTLAALWMLPVMCFGFLLCPYLDITFHHARQQLDTQKNGRLGFTLGFVGFFAFMILLTTRYAGVMTGALDGTSFVPIATPWLAAGLLTHILCQWIFTVRVHLDRIRTLPEAQPKRPLLWVVILLAGLSGFFAAQIPAYAGITGGEMIYRIFMSAYGLAFPAYVLYRVVRKNHPVGLPTMWIAVALASPMFWMGFIERQPLWLLPGMTLIILGSFLTKHRPKHIIEYILLRGLVGLVNILPNRMGLTIGWLIGAFFFHVLRYRRDNAISRLKEVFGDRFTEKERQRIAWHSFRNICFNAIEVARFKKLTPEKLRNMPLYEQMKQVQQFHRENGPLVFTTIHMGNWDLAGVAAKLDGMPIFSIARRQKNPLTDNLLNQMRNATGMEVVLNDSRILQNVVKKLKAGEVLAILPDVRSNTEALSLDFLGGKANLGPGTALFAQMAKCPVVPVVVLRKGWTQHEAKIFDPILPNPEMEKKEDRERMMQQLISIFDEQISQHPEQYFWFNKRWVLDPI